MGEHFNEVIRLAKLVQHRNHGCAHDFACRLVDAHQACSNLISQILIGNNAQWTALLVDDDNAPHAFFHHSQGCGFNGGRWGAMDHVAVSVYYLHATHKGGWSGSGAKNSKRRLGQRFSRCKSGDKVICNLGIIGHDLLKAFSGNAVQYGILFSFCIGELAIVCQQCTHPKNAPFVALINQNIV